MKKHQSPYLSNDFNWGAIQIASLYLMIGGLWILFSDRMAARIALSQEMFTTISLYKGWGYVLVTALLLYWLIRRYTARLSSSERQLQQMVDAMPLFISYVDSERHYRFTNNTYKEWFDDQAEGKHVEEVIGKAAYRTVSKYIDRALSGETTSFEAGIPYQDMELFMSVTYIPDTAADGRVKGFFVMAQDRTGQRQAQEELGLWADAFEGCAHGIAIGDPNTNRVIVCNPAFATMHKCRVEDIVGSSILSLYAPSDHEHVRNCIKKADQIGHARYESHMIRKDRSTFPVQVDVVSVLGEDGDLLYRVTTAVDISERKQAEQVLQESEERYRMVSELTSDYAYKDRIEADGSIVPEWITDSFTRITGYTLEETQAPDFWQRLIYPEDVSALIQHTQKILSGQHDTEEMRVTTKHGEVRWLRDIANPVWDASQKRVVGLYGAVQDITERKHAEEENKSLARFPAENPNPVLRATQDGKLVYANAASQLLLNAWHAQVGDYLSGHWTTLIGELVAAGSRKTVDVQCGDITYSILIVPVLEANYVNLYGRDVTERKRIEDALRQSEERFASAFRSSPTPITLTRLVDGEITDVNQAFCQLFGYSHEEVIGRTMLEIGSYDSELQSKTAKELREKGLIRNREQKARNRAGAHLHILSSTEVINIYGEFYALTTIIDITELKKAEEYLRRFELLSEHSRDIILFMKREDGRILEANAAAMQAYGYNRDEFLTLTVHDLRASDTLDLTADQMSQADAGGILFETVHKRKDGTTFPVEVSSQGATISGVRTLVSIVRDITERKQAEAALQLKDELLHLTSELAKVGGWEFDPDTGKGTWTDEVAHIHDLDPSKETNVEIGLSFYVGESRQKIEQVVKEAIELGKPYDLELEMVTAKGNHKWVRTVALPIKNDGKVTKVQGIFQDITQRKQTEEEIRRLNEELEQRVFQRTAQLEAANKELEAFSYSVSHDLRAPLRAIDGYTRILVEDYEPILDSEGKRVCAVISREARRMGQLIDDLLSFSRLGRREMHSSRIDMKAIATSVFNELMKEENAGRINFQIAKLPPAKADSSLIHQVWVNLLSNAIKFTSRKERASIEVGSKTSKDELIYYVRDTGAGFDMEYSNKLFGVFQRLHSESEFMGTGVGLAIVQRIIHRHGGRVWAEGEVEKGATFYFALPRKENHHDR
jgi:PAS domain S-box-containing protein